MTTWMVRTHNGALNAPFLERGIIALGWTTHAPLDLPVRDKEALSRAIQEASPGITGSDIRNGASVLARFGTEMKVADRVMIYDPGARAYTVGEVTSDYRHVLGDPLREGDDPRPHRRDVRWTGEVARDDLSQGTRNSLGSLMTLFRLKPGQAAEVDALLAGKRPAPGAVTPVGESADEDTLATDFTSLQEESMRRVSDMVAALSPDDMEQLVAGVLRALGYHADVTPRGPDRGTDILATPDPLGLEDPRIHVEVKHRQGKTDAPTIRTFLGGRRPGDRGIFVSTGGFTREARYEAERAAIPLRLMDAEDLVTMLLSRYREAGDDVRALVPLRPIWWPA